MRPSPWWRARYSAPAITLVMTHAGSYALGVLGALLVTRHGVML